MREDSELPSEAYASEVETEKSELTDEETKKPEKVVVVVVVVVVVAAAAAVVVEVFSF